MRAQLSNPQSEDPHWHEHLPAWFSERVLNAGGFVGNTVRVMNPSHSRPPSLTFGRIERVPFLWRLGFVTPILRDMQAAS